VVQSPVVIRGVTKVPRFCLFLVPIHHACRYCQRSGTGQGGPAAGLALDIEVRVLIISPVLH